eukprot:CAMPEP_0114235854 /NCGR_PEP_ID=MMETSP0058-20121206/6481_1 /TAXON_ID=36894 /ORGANISM="Pyramimonas parkeae, CCMP726" /LENGTH=167 /DNA_ID=CAMNT_0001347661 /DNA_START=61 /DNA_END=564 /DNA_ORIENTATION=-
MQSLRVPETRLTGISRGQRISGVTRVRLLRMRVIAKASDDLFDNPVSKYFKDLYKPNEGYRIKAGLKEKISRRPPTAVAEGKMSLEDFFESSTSEQAALREEAAANVVNIDAEERAFRTRIGVGLTALTIAVAAFMVISDVTGMSRAPIFVLVWLSVGLLGSGATGL